MIETILGGLFGGLFRLAPEVIKVVDTAGERAHELAMQSKAIEFEKIRGAQRLSEMDTTLNVSAIETLKEATRAQGTTSGVRWADALSVSVRPIITYWFMALYCGSKLAAFTADVSVEALWTPADQAMWAGVLNFWFLGRVFERHK
jgi:hypothetical protein